LCTQSFDVPAVLKERPHIVLKVDGIHVAELFVGLLNAIKKPAGAIQLVPIASLTAGHNNAPGHDAVPELD